MTAVLSRRPKAEQPLSAKPSDTPDERRDWRRLIADCRSCFRQSSGIGEGLGRLARPMQLRLTSSKGERSWTGAICCKAIWWLG